MKKLISNFLLSAIVLLNATLCFSQNAPLRVEIEAKKNSDSYNIVPLGKNGLIMFYETDEKTKGNRTWVFSKFNTNLKEDWSQEIPVQKNNTLIKFFVDDSTNTLFILLGNKTALATGSEFMTNKVSGTYQVVSVNTLTGTNNTITGEFPKLLSVADFKVINNKASILLTNYPGYIASCTQGCFNFTCIPALSGLTVFKFKAFNINVDLDNGTAKIIPIKYKGNTLILGSEIIEDTNPYLKMLVRNKPNRKETDHYLYDFSSDGELLKTLKLKPGNGKDVTSAKYQKTGTNEAIMIGTYTQFKKKGFTFNPASNDAMGLNNTSQGMYFCKFDGESQEYIKYYPFTKFENFFKFLGEYATKVLNKQNKKAAKKGKEINVNYNLLVHDLILKNGEYIMIGEAFYPQYHTTCYTTCSGGKCTQQCYTVFDGFRYTHAAIAAFDKDGEMLWDNCFEIEDILTYNLKERVKVMHDGDDIILAYSDDGYIKSQIIRGSDVIQGKEATKIETSKEGDKVKSDWSNDMAFWYDNYFLAWGYEKIKDKEKNKRNVFYFNKIGLE